jgi:hypothetical protein
VLLAAATRSRRPTSVLALRYFDYRTGSRAPTDAGRKPVAVPVAAAVRTLALEHARLRRVSGASPTSFTTLSGASGLGVTDYRTAGDLRLTKYFDGWALAWRRVLARARLHLAGRLVRVRSDRRQNRTFTFGMGTSSD